MGATNVSRADAKEITTSLPHKGKRLCDMLAQPIQNNSKTIIDDELCSSDVSSC